MPDRNAVGALRVRCRSAVERVSNRRSPVRFRQHVRADAARVFACTHWNAGAPPNAGENGGAVCASAKAAALGRVRPLAARTRDRTIRPRRARLVAGASDGFTLPHVEAGTPPPSRYYYSCSITRARRTALLVLAGQRPQPPALPKCSCSVLSHPQIRSPRLGPLFATVRVYPYSGRGRGFHKFALTLPSNTALGVVRRGVGPRRTAFSQRQREIASARW
jgi:hypothetical protein